MVQRISCVLVGLAAFLFGTCGEAVAQSAPAAYQTGYRYLDGGVLAGQISPAPVGTTNFSAVRNTYDSNGRLQKVETGVLASWQGTAILPANWTGFTVKKIETFSYDANGRLIQETFADANGVVLHVTQYSYDAYDRKICTAVRMNAAAFGSLPADACTLGAQGSDGPDRITMNAYDALNRVTQVRKAVGTSLEQAYVTYSYTADSQQQYVIDANGNRTQLTYDGLDRQAGWYFPAKAQVSGFNPATPATALSTAGAASTTDYEAYGYDSNGNRTSLRKRDGQTIAYSYDALNRMTLKDLPGGTANDVYYDYDNRGLMLDAKFSSLSGVGISYTYDFAGRKTNETSYGQAVNYQYDYDGDRTRVTWPDGYYVSYSFDGMDRMHDASEAGTTTLATYGYDQLGRIASKQYGSGAPAASVSYSWAPWDDLLTLQHTLASSANNVSFTDTYSRAHQILLSTISNAAYQYATPSAGTTAYVPNGLNQYATITPPGGSATTIGYDPNGNLTGDGTYTFTYNSENRLTSAAKAGMSATYLYDPAGRRRQTTVTGTNAGTTQFLSAGDDEIGDYDQSGALLRRYIPGRAVDQPIAIVTAGGVKTFFHQDKTGSVIAMTDGTGAPVKGPYTYDPYGNCLSGGAVCGDPDEPFKYTGRRYDPETGLYYYRARYYSPVLGRFLQTDPIGYKDDLDLYAYVGNDPTDETDPTGLCDRDKPGCVITYNYAWWANSSDKNSAGCAGGTGSQCHNSSAPPQSSTDAPGNGQHQQLQGFPSDLLVDLAAALAGPGEVALGGAAARESPAAAEGLTSLYQKLSAEGKHLKFGITKNPGTRYTSKQLAGGRLKILARGTRKDMLQLERELHEAFPIGPEEGQGFYVQKQIEKGLRPPPYN